MNRRELLAAAAALAVLPRRVRAASRRAFGGELVAALLEPPPAGSASASVRRNPYTLDPFHARTRLERELAAALHLPLFADASGGPLVESTTAADREWRITLRAGLVFADGKPIGAEDAAVSLRRLSSRATALVDAEAIEPVSERALRVVTRRPLDLPALLAALQVPVVSSASSADSSFFGPTGCGPFRPDGRRSPRGEIALEASVSSPAGRAYVDRLVLTAVPDAAALAAAFRKGQVSVAAAAAGAELGATRLVASDAAATVVLEISAKLAPALQARIASSPDRAKLSEVFLAGRVRPAATLLPPALLGPLAPQAAPPAPGSGKAAATTGLSLLVANSSGEIDAIAKRLEWDLHEAGVNVTKGWRSPAELEDVAARGRWDLLLYEWVPAALDAGWALAASPAAPAAEAAELVAAARDERLRRARALDDQIRARGTLVPIVHPRRLLRASPRVEGLEPDAYGRIAWAEVSLERGRAR